MIVAQNSQHFFQTKQLHSLLESIDYTDDNSLSPIAVPIVPNTTVHKNLIQLEHLINYREIRNYDNIGEALTDICEASDVDLDTIAFTVKEDTIIGDEYVLALVETLMNDQIPVYSIPISESDIISKYGNYCLQQIEETGDYEYWIGEQFVQYLNEEAPDTDDDEYSPDKEGAVYSEKSQKYGTIYMTYTYRNGKKVRLKLGSTDPNGEEIYDYFDFKKEVKDPSERLNLLLHGNVKGFTPQMQQNFQKAVKTYKDSHPNISDAELEKIVTSLQSENKFFMGNERGDRSFKNIDQETGQSTVNKIESDLRNHDNIHRTLQKGGMWLNNSYSRENEKDFNRAKESTLRRMDWMKKHMGEHDVAGTTDENAVKRVETIEKMIQNETFPKTWLAKKIAWLRSLYRNVMYRWSIQQKNRSWHNVGGFVVDNLKKFAAFILRVIDKLALKLQNAVN